MPAIRRLTVDLPEDLAEFVDQRVRSGEYASGAEIVINGIREIAFHHQADTEWLREMALPALAEYDADPSTGVDLEEAFDKLEEEYLARLRAAE